VRHRAAEHHRAAAVDELGVFVGAQHDAPTRPAQRLVRGRRDDVCVRDRVEVAGEHPAGDEAREVRHVDHERRVDLVGDLAQDAEVRIARVRRVARDEHERAEIDRELADRVVVEQLGGRVDAVAALVEELARDVGAEAVGEMAAGVE
jgi:hypothetical protein